VLGTSIRIFLADGAPDGLRLVSKSHWTGVALVCSRERYLTARLEREEYRYPGVYVLAGKAEGQGADGRIYIGESEDTRKRIDGHVSTLDFWTRAIVFTSKDTGLNKASIRYLESRLIELATAAGRSELQNGNAPGLSPLSEADRVDAEAFLDDMLMIYPLLGVRAFEPAEETASVPRLSLSGPSASAQGIQTDDGFLVFAGARARATPVESMPGWARSQWEALKAADLLVAVEGTDTLTLTENHEFASPSAAAAVMLGRSAAGPIEWKDADGKTLKDLTEDKIVPIDEPPLAPPAD
jgi:hypothetical protein